MRLSEKIDRALFHYSNCMTVWVILLALVAYFKPAPFVAMKPHMDLFFQITMFGIGTLMKADDFKRITEMPRLVLIGTVAQFTIMPFGAYIFAHLFNLPPALTLGLILTGAAPEAMASNVIAYVAKADLLYAVSLTTVSTLLAPILTPGLTLLLAHESFHIDFWAMFFSLVSIIIVPLGIGFFLRHFSGKLLDPILRFFPALSTTFIVFICALVVALNKGNLSKLTLIVIIACVCLNVNGMLMGYGVGKLFKMNVSRCRTLSIEVGMQNAGLGTLIALKYFAPETAIPAALFVVLCLTTASIAAQFWQRH
ncbi:MAG TPA: bile acid:sodium symporter family protein [Candidatus Omnitrophota bacterium]|nr:bile acid:sodium symporter family protein [Candidatus Omnitrophota bacterium]